MCNVAYKIVTKMIVNRLKGVLGELITPYQAIFVPGRQSVNNVVVCQEIVQSLKSKKVKGGNSGQIGFVEGI